MRKILLPILTGFLLVACNGSPTIRVNPTSPDSPVSNEPGNMPVPTADPYAPQPGDDKFLRGNVYIDLAELLALEIYPPQYMLKLTGSLPTPCNQLRLVVNPPDGQNQIIIEAYSVLDPSQICIQVLKDFHVTLALGSYPKGHYSIWINNQKYEEFDAQ